MNNKDKQKTAFLGLLTQTSLHAGAGQSIGVIDLPVQREGHNGWPCVYGSAMKGALRTRAEDIHGKTDADLLEVFGPDTEKSSDYASAIAVSDARLLLLPVRSLTSHFKWVTCPEALKRLKRDADLLGMTLDMGKMPHPVNDDQAIVPEKETDLFLEEYRFTCEPQDLSSLINILAMLMQRYDAEVALKEQLVIVSDDTFAHFVKHAIPVNAHIAIESKTKIVKQGALWYEEDLPPDTLLYTCLIANSSRKKIENGNTKKTAEKIMGFVSDLFTDRPWLQVGGNETVGMGWCGVKMYPEDNGRRKNE